MVAVGVLTVAAGFGWFAGMVGCLDFGLSCCVWIGFARGWIFAGQWLLC